MTLIKFRRSCLFEGQVLFEEDLAPFRSALVADDVKAFRTTWRSVRKSFTYDSIAVTGLYWDAIEDLLADGISEIQHLDADRYEPLPCIGEPVVAESRPNDWSVEGDIDGNMFVAAWRVIHFPKGFYTYGLPLDLPALDLHDVELRPREGLGSAPFFVPSIRFKGQVLDLIDSEDGSGYADSVAIHLWERQEGKWRRVWAIDEGV